MRFPRLHLQLLPAVVLPLLLAACTTTNAGLRPMQHGLAAAVRPPTPGERARIVVAVNETWKYESEPAHYLNLSYHLHIRRPRVRPNVVRIRVSRADPRFSSAVIELRDARGRRRGPAAVMVFKRIDHDAWSLKHLGAWVVAPPAQGFPNACTAATPRGIRALLCPSAWSVLGYQRPRVRAQTVYTQRIPSPDLHTVAWNRVTLPGGVCGSSRPIRLHHYRYGGPAAFIHADVDLLWWNPVVVSSWQKPVFGDLDGDGRDEAALNVGCANGGGTAAGQLAFSDVIFKAVGKSLRVVGIVTPQQPLDPQTSHVPLSHVAAVKRGKVVVSEAWYGRYDGTCCASGRATTIWTYAHGQLRPMRTKILQKPWSSPLLVRDIVAQPGDQELAEYEMNRVVASPRLRFAVTLMNEEDVTKRHVKVTLTIRQSSSPIVRTRTFDKIAPFDAETVFFRNLSPVQLGTKSVTLVIHAVGTNPVRYRVIFIRG